ncbi:hypothetical protein DL766_000048 [Monosporascus sp. MC13-8B]|uniref:Tryptophan synthase beta chain-like PALP domain-containing protein n=1 Tax=Monosporascus cannonballus TaxID=155416 RepID=A0ABY0HJW7_9PEZI|nr:hypothetical protein DL762_000417 [Monosporascus cannonballus]RYP40247.1 hypothetical protein DL766_000048 [Monosporascus sp. MC13-8B]
MLLSQDGASEKRIVEASSGSPVLSLGILSRVLWGNEDVTAYVTNKKHPDTLRLLRFFGLKVSLYGGLAQQEPTDPHGIMSRLRRLATEDENTVYPGQYDNENNWKSHERWTGPQILKQLPEIRVFSTTVGTGGCITGAGTYLKSQKLSVKVIGPDPMSETLPRISYLWLSMEGHSRRPARGLFMDSYRMSMLLSREGIIAGPSSGEALKGLLDYLELMKKGGRLSELSEPLASEIACVFTCSDLPYRYLDGYFQKLGEHEFGPIENPTSQMIAEIGRRELPSLVVCYDGDASRLATSILRAKGIQAFSILGGFRKIQETWVLGTRDASKAIQPTTTLREYQAD